MSRAPSATCARAPNIGATWFVSSPLARCTRRWRSPDEPNHRSEDQRRRARARGRAVPQPPRRAAQRRAAHRDEEGLRRGRLRRVHGDRRRKTGQLLPDARRRSAGLRGADDRRAAAPIAGEFHRARRRAVRLLHAGDDHDGESPARREPASHRGRDSLRNRRQHLSLHRLHQDHRGDQGGVEAMSEVIGSSVRRPDMPGKVTGAARYAGDLHLPGMLHAKIKRSTIAHANIKRIDATRALAYPGAKAVLTHENVPRVLHYGSPHPRSASVTRDQYILDRKVRYWGEGVAAVAAVSEEIAEEALDLIEVEYEELAAALTVEQALAAGAPRIHERADNLVVDPVLVKRGDPKRGFAQADLIVEGTYEMGRPTPAYMEPNVCVCDWDDEGKLTVWISTQTPFMVRGILAEVLGVPYARVRVLVDHMGGGFGA